MSAAIWHQGVVYSVPRPGRHHDVVRMMNEKHGLGPGALRHQGFVTSAGRFVDRKEANLIARAADQIKVKTAPDHILFSEDLW